MGPPRQPAQVPMPPQTLWESLLKAIIEEANQIVTEYYARKTIVEGLEKKKKT